MTQINKISFCTVSMNRLSFVKSTFLENVVYNRDYPNVEFNLLDYNSTDGLEDWAKHNLQEYIKEGIVNYFKISTPKYFHRSHSRNLVFRLASGDIICNIDADNFTGPNFANYIGELFAIHGHQIIIVAPSILSQGIDRNAMGRIACMKSQFTSIRGMDERMSGYGFEDTDFKERLLLTGARSIEIDNIEFLRSIPHPQILRINEEWMMNSIKLMLLFQIDYKSSEIIVFFSNNTFEKYTLIDTTLNDATNISRLRSPTTDSGILFHNNAFESGTWTKESKNLSLYFDSTNNNKILKCLKMPGNNNCYRLENKCFYEIKQSHLLEECCYVTSSLKNRLIMAANNAALKQVNTEGFGRGIIHKNFSGKQIVLD